MKLKSLLIVFAMPMALLFLVVVVTNSPSASAKDLSEEPTTTVISTDVITTTASKQPNFDGCPEVVLDGPTLVWPGSTVKFTGDVTWPGKPHKYDLWDGYSNLIYSMKPYEKVSFTFTTTVIISESPYEFAGNYYVRIQGPLTGPYCEETHTYGIVSPVGVVFMPIIAALNND